MWSNDHYAEPPSTPVGAPVAPLAPDRYAHASLATTAEMDAQRLAQPQQQAIHPISHGASDIPRTLRDQVELAKLLAESDLVPRSLQGKPANVLLIMHKALALDIPLIVAVEHLHVIDGKVGHSAELLRALISRAGHVLRWTSITDTSATGVLVLRHDKQNPRSETFSIQDAQRMKLTGKDNWTKDPASMLVARVTTRLVSRHCPEIGVTLGNLAAMDYEDTPGAVVDNAPAAVDPDIVQRENVDAAVLLLDKARKAVSKDRLVALGKEARDGGLLDVQVDGQSVHAALLRRMEEVTGARKDAGTAEAAAETREATR